MTTGVSHLQSVAVLVAGFLILFIPAPLNYIVISSPLISSWLTEREGGKTHGYGKTKRSCENKY
jgi:hypothetical protein